MFIGSNALQVFSCLPAGCELHKVRNDYNAPHLHAGDLAVVAPTDNEFVSGQVYRVEWNAGSARARMDLYRVMLRTYRNNGGTFEGIYFGPIVEPVILPDGTLDLDPRKTMWSGDGPLRTEYLHEYLRGRVIGIFEPFAPMMNPLALLPATACAEVRL